MGIDSLVNLVKCMTPPERLQQSFSVAIEAGDVECGGKGFDAIKPPRATVVNWVCGNKVWNCEVIGVSLQDTAAESVSLRILS